MRIYPTYPNGVGNQCGIHRLDPTCAGAGYLQTTSTDPSHYWFGHQCGRWRRVMWEGLYPGLPEWEFPLHGVWGKLAELWMAGLVWTPRLGVPRVPSAGSWERSRFAIAVGSYTPAQGDGWGLPRPRQTQSHPGDPWTCMSRPLNYNNFNPN